MKIKCAWCGLDMGAKPGPTEKISHSICDECKRIVMEETDDARRNLRQNG
jgi:hypothetical protein